MCVVLQGRNSKTEKNTFFIVPLKSCSCSSSHLVGLGNVSTAMDKHAVQHLQHLRLFQYKLRHPHSVGNVAHASQRKQVALCAQDGLPSGQPLLKASPTCGSCIPRLHPEHATVPYVEDNLPAGLVAIIPPFFATRRSVSQPVRRAHH